MSKKISLLLVFALVLTVLSSCALAAVTGTKEATALTADDKTTVTLKVPAAETPIPTDIVFVLDSSSCSEETYNQFIELFEALKAKKEATGSKIKVGFVIFRGGAKVLELKDVADWLADERFKDAATFKETFKGYRNSLEGGSNLQLGLLQGEKLLDDDSATPADNKFLITISDGVVYSWQENSSISGTQLTVYFGNDDNYTRGMLGSNSALEVWNRDGKSMWWTPSGNDWGAFLDGESDKISSTEKKALKYDRSVPYTYDVSKIAIATHPEDVPCSQVQNCV